MNKNNISSLDDLLAESLYDKFRLIVEEAEKTDNEKDKTDDKTEVDSDVLKELGLDQSDLDKSINGLDDKKKGLFLKVLSFVGKMLNSASNSQIASNLDNFTLGNFKEVLCDIYKGKLEKMSEDDLNKQSEALHQVPGFDKALKKGNLDSRKDDNENSEIDESSATCNALFWSEKPEDNLLKQLETLTIEILKQAKQLADTKENLKKEILNKKIEGIGDGEIDAFGPMISNMIKSGKSNEEIAKKVSEMKTGVKESYDRKVLKYSRQKLLTEGKVLITERQKNIFLMESLCESDEYITHMTLYLINEGFFDGIKKMAKATGKLASKAIKGGKELAKVAWNQVPEKYRNTIKDLTDKALDSLKNGALGPILSIAGIGLMVVTGSWGIALLIATMTLISKHGKYLKAAFDKHWDAFKNSKGVITQMDFNIKGDEKLKYSLRYYIVDQTWRVLNLRNLSQTPSLKFAKEILGSNIGKKYIEAIQKKWDPVFNKEKGGKIDFAELLAQSKDLDLSDKELKLLNDFKDQYDTTISRLTKPLIDTRAVSAKDAMK